MLPHPALFTHACRWIFLTLMLVTACQSRSASDSVAASLQAASAGTEKGSTAPAGTARSAVQGAAQAGTDQSVLSVGKEGTETALIAGGCFWGMEDILRKVPGVLNTEVGYAGGRTSEPDYEQVHTGITGHAESVRITFDSSKLSFEELLEKWFFRMHNPTTLNRQGNDVGTQYRSAIFYTSEAQHTTAGAVKKRVDASGLWQTPAVTEITAAGTFTRAEDYHQDYLVKNPGGYTCHYMR